MASLYYPYVYKRDWFRLMGASYEMRYLPLYFNSRDVTESNHSWGYWRIYFFTPNLPFVLYYEHEYDYTLNANTDEFDEEREHFAVLNSTNYRCHFELR